jgi:abortive infection bacteriophage resistance protein
MKYAKPPLTLDQQADQLLRRGMVGDRDLIVSRLQAVSYFRLSGYWYPFRLADPADPSHREDRFRDGTTFEEVWNRYAFDRRLRLLVMDAIERIEVAVRSQLAYYHAHRHGAFAYATEPRSLPSLQSAERRKRFLEELDRQHDQSKETFVEHFRIKYGDQHDCLPVWMACEVMTFGGMLTFHRGCHPDIRREISKPFGVHDTVFDSWLLSLNTVRNICAHHGRLWNRELGTKPKIPAKDPSWKTPVTVGNDRVFCVLTLCKWSLDRIAPQSRWANRLRGLLEEFPAIPIVSMGFPTNWERCPIWAAPAAALQGGKQA